MELVSASQLDDFKCALCQNLLREPQLNDCCGEHLCRTCVKPFVDEGQPCPLPHCNSQTFQVIPDKKLTRRMERAKIHCSMREQGCEWVGKLENLESHLDPTSGDCGYIHVDCTNGCGGRVLRHQLPYHLERDCPRRRYSCEYCGCSASYENVCTKHVAVCKKYPVPCPNECGVRTVERCCLKQHLQKECLYQEENCNFSHAGCTAKLRRKDADKHMKENIYEHLRLLSIRYGEPCVRLDQKEKPLDEVQAERDKQMEQQSQQMMRIETHVSEILARLKAQDQEILETSEMKLMMNEHEHLITRDRFRDRNVNECEECVHMEGFEPEPQAPWPHMQGLGKTDSVKIPEGIQASGSTNLANMAHPFYPSAPPLMEGFEPEPQAPWPHMQGLGKTDSVKIPEGIQASGSTNLANMAHPFYPSAPPLTEFKFYMHKLSSSLSRSPANQGYNPQQKSPVFYTFREGYMMQVHAYDSGRGVSVYVYICRGEYDDTLEWPLSASITITLVNANRTQLLSKTLTGKWNQVAKPGMIGEHMALHPFATCEEVNDCLRDDCLHFEVTSVHCYPAQ